ncbi:hypothetical protein SAMN05428967_1014 [Phyllobacterium sp. YR620]|uniref:tetratricopeptide repeat protein n=1 Tax=Phyllobacterium sp. YR620 TaxID=1881066 RepID=UPI00089246BE|nr:hypothetical protein [Phyllobacterium sp. YR620]SDP05030.1 hypothetical protein SAMN05428967_1014 [Phyllobacterium sp. YR620]
MEVDFNVDMPDSERISEEEARAELDRLLSDPQFHSTERNRNFLRFVAQEMFEGRAASVKAYTIAVDVFGRPSSFDPTTDPIVRIEATRLRASLAQYYESRAEEGSVRIELPRGRYIPVFTKAPPQAEVVEECEEAEEQPVLPPAQPSHSFITKRHLAVAAGVVCITAISLVAVAANRRVFSDKPVVAVEMKLAGDGTDAEAGLIRDYLMTALSQFQTLTLAAAEMPSPVKATVPALSWFRSARRAANPYHVVLKYHPDINGRAVWWQVVDPVSGEALRSGVERANPDDRPDTEVRRELVTDLATRFAGPQGVINNIEYTRELASPSLGNGCILRTGVALERQDAAELDAVRDCLAATLQAMPNNPDANAAMAVTMIESAAPEVVNGTAAQALLLANKAVALAPMSDRAGYAQMLALYHNGQSEAAFVAGYRAMALNPNNSFIPAKLGAMFFANGNWTEGANLASRAEQINGTQDDAELILALDAYRKGDFTKAVLKVQQMGHSGNYLADVLELAAFGQLGDASGVRETMDRVTRYRDRFWTTFRADMIARRYAPAMIDGLEAGLAKAGLPLAQPLPATN